jgi:hypothetical protein
MDCVTVYHMCALAFLDLLLLFFVSLSAQGSLLPFVSVKHWVRCGIFSLSPWGFVRLFFHCQHVIRFGIFSMSTWCFVLFFFIVNPRFASAFFFIVSTGVRLCFLFHCQHRGSLRHSPLSTRGSLLLFSHCQIRFRICIILWKFADLHFADLSLKFADLRFAHWHAQPRKFADSLLRNKLRNLRILRFADK